MKRILPVTLSDIKKELLGKISFEFMGNESAVADNIADLSDSDGKSLIWISEKKGKEINPEDISGAIIFIPRGVATNIKKDTASAYVVSQNPRLAFALAVNGILNSAKDYEVHPSAVISPNARISSKVAIGANSFIGEVIIDEGTKIGANCYIHDNTVIGKNVNVFSGTVIGGPGFGYEKDEEGNWVLFPHIGGVIIEDNVDIGGNTCIDRGALGNTILKKGSKVDNLVHIAHNVVLEENSLVIAHAMVAGSVKVGRNAWVAPGAQIKNGLSIGKDSFIGLGAVVVKNVPDGETWIGNPAKPLTK